MTILLFTYSILIIDMFVDTLFIKRIPFDIETED